MTKRKSTKSALFTSVLALFLCFSMLLGTTYAWFTDEASTGRNTIQSGNLDLEVRFAKHYPSGSWNWQKVDSNTDIFDDNMYYEPGTTQVVYLEVKNAGSLSMKVNAMLDAVETVGKNKDNEDIKLSEILKFGLIDLGDSPVMFSSREAARDAVAGNEKNLLDEYLLKDLEVYSEKDADGNQYRKTVKYYALVVYMPEEAGNDANHNGTNIPKIELGLNVIATQLNSEKDSFTDNSNGIDNNNYDVNAEFGFTPVEGTTWTNVKNALETETPVQIALDNDYTLTAEEVITITNGNKKILDLNGHTITASNYQLFNVNGGALTIMDSTGTGKIVFSNMAGKTGMVVQNNGKLVIGKGVTVEASADYNTPGYVVKAEANSVVNVDGATFNLSNKAIGILADGNPNGTMFNAPAPNRTINISGATFNVTNSAAAAVRQVNVNISSCNVSVNADDGKYAYAYVFCGQSYVKDNGTYTISADTVINKTGTNAKDSAYNGGTW